MPKTYPLVEGFSRACDDFNDMRRKCGLPPGPIPAALTEQFCEIAAHYAEGAAARKSGDPKRIKSWQGWHRRYMRGRAQAFRRHNGKIAISPPSSSKTQKARRKKPNQVSKRKK